MIRKELIPALRQEAEEYAKKILGDKVKKSKNYFDSKFNTTKKFKSGLHSFMSEKDIDYCINNGLDIGYLYDAMASKYGGNDDIDKPKKKYYQPNGNKRGRPKKENNEQE